MASEFALQYFELSKEELLQLDSHIFNQLRQEMGDQEFIDQWKLTQEEYSYLINDIQSEEFIDDIPIDEEETQVTETTEAEQEAYEDGDEGETYEAHYIENGQEMDE